MPSASDTYTPQPITAVASRLDLQSDEFSSYGPLMGKIRTQVLERLAEKPDGKLILVTAISPRRPEKARPPSPSASRRRSLAWERTPFRARVSRRWARFSV